MGKWNFRRSRRSFYHQYRDPASSYYDPYKPHPPLPDYNVDGIPSWEKKFCTLIGSVPWQKIVNVKEFIFCHDNVANWDDSAGEEAFQCAKRRFWEDINGLPSESAFPDPDMYIEDVNWNPNIDHELIEDLERSLFVPEEGEEDREVECERKNKNAIQISSAPSEEWNRNPGDTRTTAVCSNNPQNSLASENKSQGWNQSPDGADISRNNDNPWDSCIISGNEAVKGNTWGDCSTRIKLQAWNKSEENVNQLTDWNKCTVSNDDNNPWEKSISQENQSREGSPWNRVDQSKDWHTGGNTWKRGNWGPDPRKETTWGNLGHSRWGSNPNNQWERNFAQSRGSPSDRQWRGRGRNESSWRWSENQFRELKDSGSRQPSRGWGACTESLRKRGGNHQYATSNKHRRFGDDNYQTGHQWR